MAGHANCARCGEHFHYEHKRKYCSPKCYATPVLPRKPPYALRGSDLRGIRDCRECGRDITGFHGRAVFCSLECKKRHINARKKERNSKKQTKVVSATCKECGSGFSYAQSWKGRPREICSGDCKSVIYRRLQAKLKSDRDEKRQREAFKRFDKKARNIKARADSRRRECSCCGVLFLPSYQGALKGARGTMCSKACSITAATEAAQARMTGVKKGDPDYPKARLAWHGLRAEIAALRRIASRQGFIRKVEECPCCHKSFMPKWANQTCCSDVCRQERNRRLNWEARRGRVISCGWCSVEFCATRGTADNPHGNQGFCSDECRSKRIRQARRDAKKIRSKRIKAGRREVVDRLRVFRRDGWKCQACGCDTPQELLGTMEDDSPQLDHIVPLAAGGTHTYDNVQLLCALCNLFKQDMPMDQFVAEWVAVERQ